MYFYLKSSRVHVFCLGFSQVCIFFDEDCSRLVPEPTQPGGFLSLMIVDKLTKT